MRSASASHLELPTNVDNAHASMPPISTPSQLIVTRPPMTAFLINRDDFEDREISADAGGEHGEDGAREYFAVIVQEPDMTFHATFPDLPGCAATAATFDGARGAAGKALTRCLDDMKRAGDSIPEPSTLETIIGGEDEHCGAAILVREATRRPAPDD
jgi:predicted RNase H-like HicB family nuclease